MKTASWPLLLYEARLWNGAGDYGERYPSLGMTKQVTALGKAVVEDHLQILGKQFASSRLGRLLQAVDELGRQVRSLGQAFSSPFEN